MDRSTFFIAGTGAASFTSAIARRSRRASLEAALATGGGGSAFDGAVRRNPPSRLRARHRRRYQHHDGAPDRIRGGRAQASRPGGASGARRVRSRGLSLLYPLALGISPFDPYALGYHGRVRGLLVALALVAVFAWWRGRLLLLLALLLGVGAFRLEALESTNLWDYLLDPWLAAGFVGFTIFGRFSKSR